MWKQKAKRLARSALPDPLYRGVFRPAVRKILSAAFGRRGMRIRIGSSGVFRMSPDLYFRGWEEFGDRHNGGFARCVEACRRKSVFFDVGAHVGLYALPASRVLAASGTVYAFEPTQYNVRYLQRHAAMNKIENIRVFQVAVGDRRDDAVRFFEALEPSSPMSGFSLPTKNDGAVYVEKRVPQICLDDFCAEQGLRPEVIKIDVEGAEIHVLEGARQVLTAARPLLFLSVHPAHLLRLGRSTAELMALVRSAGYRVETPEGVAVTDLAFGEYVCVPTST